ncbi:Exocyst complex subunit Sec15-like family-containing protein [Strongyloides ratti]|uniref:Exocyst complex component n=1 Tax=Strongyloides ratti TaxID=34506 RepID=A0A090L205_STRRB|nr:Exocyst complex subunit Sec15-like family-containing protein [Strongyloides ratti]CEF63692.1 Exocyst complex subunit Sec15-like family-containing protein [Strongyloides ratti]
MTKNNSIFHYIRIYMMYANGTTKLNNNKNKIDNSISNSYEVQTSTDINAEQEYFLYELETTDSSSVGLVLRAIYEGGDVAKFTRALERKIVHYDKSILNVSNYHYQGFVESMKQLAILKTKVAEIRDKAEDINGIIQSNATDLITHGEELIRYRRFQRNAKIAMDQITQTLPILENYSKIKELMYQGKYYQALKILEEMEHTHRDYLSKYRFTHALAKSFSGIRQQIKEKSFSEFTDFLELISKVSQRIGKYVMKNSAESFDQERNVSETMNISDHKKSMISNTFLELSFDGSLKKKNIVDYKAKADDDFDEENNNPLDIIDFAPIHRCCQIYNILSEKGTFQKLYRDQRQAQANVVIEPSSKMTSNTSGYLPYLQNIVGFFVVEDYILQREPLLSSTNYKNSLWETALKKIKSTMDNHFGQCVDIAMMLKIKKMIFLFALTMKSYGYDIQPLYHLLKNFRDQYNEILMSEYCSLFEKTLNNDNYTPIVCNDEKQFLDILKQFPFHKRGLDKEPFPRKFPFSDFVPTVFTQAKMYLEGCLKFMEHLQMGQSEIDDTIRRYANVLLSRWAASIKSFCRDKNRNLVQLTQIIVNIGYLEKGVPYLEEFIKRLTKKDKSLSQGTGHLVSLKDQVFKDAKCEVESQIDNSLQSKIDEFFNLNSYDWDLQVSKGVSSEYITDLLAFLQTIFVTFKNLPPALARHLCMQLCKYLSECLTKTILNSSVKSLSSGAIDQFSLDVMQCENFTLQCPVSGFEDGSLAMTFASLRQLLDLVMAGDWSTFLADCGKKNQGKYQRVKPAEAITILEKMIEYEKKTNSFFGIGKGEKRKLLDTILKQLKSYN